MNSCSRVSLLETTSKPFGSCCCFASAPVAITSSAQQRQHSPPSLLPTMTWQSPVAYASCWVNPPHRHSARQGTPSTCTRWPWASCASVGHSSRPRSILGLHNSQLKCFNSSTTLTQPRLQSKPRPRQQAHCRPPAGTFQAGET